MIVSQSDEVLVWYGETNAHEPASTVPGATFPERGHNSLAAMVFIEQDHHFVKRRVVTSQGFRSADGAISSIAGYEARNIIPKGQVRWLPKGDVVGQKLFIEGIFGIAA